MFFFPSSHEEGWVPKNWCFQTMVLEKTLENPLDCKEIQPVHPKGNQPWIFIRRLFLKLRLQYFGHLMQRANSLEKTLMLGKIEGRRRRRPQRMRWLDDITNLMDTGWVNSRSLCWTGRPGVLQSVGLQRVRHDWATEQQQEKSWRRWESVVQILRKEPTKEHKVGSGVVLSGRKKEEINSASKQRTGPYRTLYPLHGP